MKRIFTLFALFSIVSSAVHAQFPGKETKSPQLMTSSTLGGQSVFWTAPLAASNVAATDGVFQSTSPPFTATDQYSDFLFSTDFGFTVPSFATIDSVIISIVRQRKGGPAGIRDNRLRLVSGGSLVGDDNAATATDWPNTPTQFDYPSTGSPTWGLSLTPAQVNDPSFGFGLVVMKLVGAANPQSIADVDRIQITVVYNSLFPIVLTNFEVKNVDGKVNISFTTESETKVKTLFIERSSDGRNYTDLFAIQPKGGENIRTNYNLTDAAPLLGSNYYRLKEIDIDGNWHYYETRFIKISNVTNKFQAYQNNNRVIVNFNNTPGNYTLSLIDMNGAIVATKNFTVDKQAVQVTLDPPVKSTGIYLVNLRGGDNYNASLKLFIQR